MPLRSISPHPLRLRLGVSALGAALIASTVVGVAAPAQALTPATFSVDCAAKSNGDGVAAPFNSLAAVNGHGAYAPGDRILFKRGTTCRGHLRPAGSGAAGQPILIGAYGAGARPTIAGGGTANFTGAVQLVNQQYWTVQDLHVTNTTKSANTKTYRSGVLVQNSGVGRLAGLTLQRLTIDSVRSNAGNGNTRAYGGISALTFGTAASGFDGLRILNNSVSNASRSGIISSNAQWPKAWDSNSRIAGNTVRNVRGDGIVIIGARNGRIDHNVVAGAGNLGTCSHCGRLGGPSTASAGIWPSATRSITIEYNEVYGTHATGGDGEGFDIDRDAKDTVLQYNYAHDNEGGGVLVCGGTDSTIRFNVLENNKKSALTFYGKAPSKNTSFYNNTVYASRAVNAKVVRTFGAFKGGKVTFKNNVIYSYGRGQYEWPSKNLVTSANTLVGTHGVGRPHDAGTSWSAPRLRAPGTGGIGFPSLKGYRLKTTAGAPRGAAIPSSVKADVFGKKVDPKHPVRGASSSS